MNCYKRLQMIQNKTFIQVLNNKPYFLPQVFLNLSNPLYMNIIHLQRSPKSHEPKRLSPVLVNHPDETYFSKADAHPPH